MWGYRSRSNEKHSEKIKETSFPEKSLEDWKLPSSSASVFKRSCLFNFSPEPKVKTVEKEITLSEGFASFPLLSDNLKRVYRAEDSDIYVGIVEVALKPTTLGSSASAIICLRDKRCKRFYESVLGMVESSLSDGPIYFSCIPTDCVYLHDTHLSSSFTIDIKIQGSGDGNIILMYRFHYKLMKCPYRKKKLLRIPIDGKGETTLFIARTDRVVSRKIYWDQVSVPERWKDENHSFSSSSAGGGKQGDVARIDLKVDEEAYVMKVDVAGFKRDEVRVEVEDDGSLVISGERRNNEEDKNGMWRCVERSSGKFLRRFKLPENAWSAEVTAAMESGVLTVTMPKGEVNDQSEVKVIQISG